MPATPWPRTSDEQPADGSYAATSSGHALDCYPYTFSPLLLFAQDKYFDKGYSNYNSVAAFFAPVLDYELEINMLDNVLYERKNMRYDELYEFVTERRMLVICCIDAHFTAFQVLGKTTLAYYDPLKPSIGLVTGEQSFRKLVCFLLLKCNYGDNQHLQESKSYYVGADSNPTRRAIYALWRDINKTEVDSLYDVRFRQASLNLSRPMFINGMRDFRTMSTQLTSCTCYFQARHTDRTRTAVPLIIRPVRPSPDDGCKASGLRCLLHRAISSPCCAKWARPRWQTMAAPSISVMPRGSAMPRCASATFCSNGSCSTRRVW